jgi:hypothetical protein
VPYVAKTTVLNGSEGFEKIICHDLKPPFSKIKLNVKATWTPMTAGAIAVLIAAVAGHVLHRCVKRDGAA